MNAIRIVLVVVDATVGLTAIGGGIALAAGLEGERYPVEWLTGTPFSSYLIPGLSCRWRWGAARLRPPC